MVLGSLGDERGDHSRQSDKGLCSVDRQRCIKTRLREVRRQRPDREGEANRMGVSSDVARCART